MHAPLASAQSSDLSCYAPGRGPVQPEKGAYGNAIMRFPLDLKDVEDFFIPANGVYLDNVCYLRSAVFNACIYPCLLTQV